MIVNRNKGFARFAFMHCIVSSLCFWIYTIINETLDALVSKKYFHASDTCTYDDGSESTTTTTTTTTEAPHFLKGFTPQSYYNPPETYADNVAGEFIN